MRIMAIDPGEKRIGIALSDPTHTIASRLTVIDHVSFDADIEQLLRMAIANDVEMILLGLALDDEGRDTSSSRRSKKLGQALTDRYHLKVEYFDEYGTTRAAKLSAIEMNVRKSKRKGHLDDIAATILLQRYLDMQD